MKSKMFQCKALSQKLRGHDSYYGVTGNYRALLQPYERARRLWHHWLGRRRNRPFTWGPMLALLTAFRLPRPRRQLASSGLIRRLPDRKIAALKRDQEFDLAQYVELTPLGDYWGERYMSRRQEVEGEDETEELV